MVFMAAGSLTRTKHRLQASMSYTIHALIVAGRKDLLPKSFRRKKNGLQVKLCGQDVYIYDLCV